ncbi:hypothetical protein ES703_60117 [subsurface metagenome]
MKTLKLVLLMVMLLIVGMLAGCQEEYASRSTSDPTKKKKVIWEPTGTGFWHPKVTYSDAD